MQSLFDFATRQRFNDRHLAWLLHRRMSNVFAFCATPEIARLHVRLARSANSFKARVCLNRQMDGLSGNSSTDKKKRPESEQ